MAAAGGLLSHARTGRVFAVPDAVDVSTTSAHDFDVDAASGFMPPQPPDTRLPSPAYDAWEAMLVRACTERLRPADADGLTLEQQDTSYRWRGDLCAMDVVPTDALQHSETLLRRAHHVLTFLLSFYAHSHPRPAPDAPPEPLHIPASVAVPLSTVSRAIGIAPVVTYADTVLWNWARSSSNPSSEPNMNPLAPSQSSSTDGNGSNDLTTLTLFTGLHSEAHFYITSARIELASARALSFMQRTLDELFLGDALALKRIAAHLSALALVIDEMTALLGTMYAGCDPREFYTLIRPWFRGGEAWPGGAGWAFDGVADETERERARFTNGASAGQSSIVHALDIFLGTPNADSPYLHKMEYHMPRHHRAFLRHLRARPAHSALPALLAAAATPDAVRVSFNGAVLALKRFRDAHIRIAVTYVVSQARAAGGHAGYGVPLETEGVKGTGGTDLVPFLKNLRDNTARTVVPVAAAPVAS